MIFCPPPQSKSSLSGFTLIELLVVVALIAIATAVTALALREPALSSLEREAGRLVALLEAARAEARAAGIAVRWVPRMTPQEGPDFQFVGLPKTLELPNRWLEAEVRVEIANARAIVLGPEPLIGPQRIVLTLQDQRLVIATDGMSPFVLVTEEIQEPAP